MRFIHYGNDFIDYSKPYPVKMDERRKFQNKPSGLWATPVNTKYNWKQFVEYQWPSHYDTLKKHVEFTLKPFTNILVIKNKFQLGKLPMHIDYSDYHHTYINWPEIRKKYDGVIIYVSKFKEETLLTFNLNGWDVDSLCLWNLNQIKEVK